MHCSKRLWAAAFAALFGVSALSVELAKAEQEASATMPAVETEAGYPYVGEVTGENVYVRSRGDQNWYPTTKLQKGDRVEVHGSQFTWLKIRPPRGSFCYIDKKLVVRDQSGVGVVSGDNVYVRAGSELEEYARNKTAVLTRLGKGAEVKILGEHPDGYYKIAPPKGAFYWISQRYVRRVGDVGDVSVRTTKPPEPLPIRPPGTGAERAKGTPPAVDIGAMKPAGVARAVTRPAKTVPKVNWQGKLDEVEAELKVALRPKARNEKDLLALRKRLLPISAQTQDDVVQQWAKIRIGDIDRAVDALARRARILEISERATRLKQRAAASQAAVVAATPVRPDYQGKLVRSYAFEGRYRIVDPKENKTLVYVEFPEGSGLDPSTFVGRYVKVRMKSKRYDKDARCFIVEPAAIVAANEALLPTTGPVGPPAPGGAPEASADQPAGAEAPE